MARYQSYVICTTPRSGSTLLCKLLAATGKAGKPESHFHEPSISKWLGYYGLKSTDFTSDRDTLGAIFDAARTQGSSDNGIFGLRLQRHSFAFLIEQMGILHPGLAADLARFRAAFGDTLFIHLSRPNKLEQAVSYVKASQTGLWHMAPDGTELERLSEPREPVYDAGEIARQLAELSAFDTAWEDWFGKENIEPLPVSYDTLSADPSSVLACILDWLGLGTHAANHVSPGVAKLADATSQRWIERFLAERGSKPDVQA